MQGLAAAQRQYDRQAPRCGVDSDAADAQFANRAAYWHAALRRMVMTQETFPGRRETAAEYIANDIPGWMTDEQAVALLRGVLSLDRDGVFSIIARLANDALKLNAEKLAEEE